jgi:hypothetical protein
MLIQANNVVLFIHPKKDMETFVLDEISLKMEYALENPTKQGVICRGGILKKGANKGECTFKEGESFLGVHTCTGCHIVRSSSSDRAFLIIKKDGTEKEIYTNTLAYHYLVSHRSECSERDLAIVNNIVIPKNYVPKGYFRKNF